MERCCIVLYSIAIISLIVALLLKVHHEHDKHRHEDQLKLQDLQGRLKNHYRWHQ
jgi:hypothetical protein